MARMFGKLLSLGACVALCACGGGGGGSVNSTPAPTPDPTSNSGPAPAPSPTNTAIANLKVSQAFAGDGTTNNVVLRTADGVVTSTAQSRAALQVRYDASSQSYTIETAGRTQTFAQSDAQPQRFAGETTYAKAASGDYLTLVTTPYYAATASNQYVGLGYWQHNDLNAGTQSTQFSTFTYGFDTSGASVPRSGTAHWRTDIFGLLTAPNIQLRTIQGQGGFDVDFASSVFSTSANVDEFDFITGGGRVGSLRFQGGGPLASGNGFVGDFSYNGSAVLAGTISGRFYGPAADEIGATFNAQGGTTVLTGALTGQRDAAAPAANLTLVNVLATQRLVASTASTLAQKRGGEAGFADVKGLQGSGFVTVTPGGQGPVEFDSSGYTPVRGELVASGRPNFTTYLTQRNGQPLRVEYYKPGNANTELALTYTSFVTWTASALDTGPGGQQITNLETRFLLYGVETPRDLLAGRTGGATYTGVVYGSGASREGAQYDVSGTSRFDVDFSSSRYSGSLNLAGKALNGVTTSFGIFNFASQLAFGEFGRASFDNGANADPFHYIQPRFYGTNGQEIGATFNLSTGLDSDPRSVLVSGVTVAKQQ